MYVMYKPNHTATLWRQPDSVLSNHSRTILSHLIPVQYAHRVIYGQHTA